MGRGGKGILFSVFVDKKMFYSLKTFSSIFFVFSNLTFISLITYINYYSFHFYVYLCVVFNFKSKCMYNKTWVYPITKVPYGYSNNPLELLKYYREQKKLTSDITSWKCDCCQKDKHQLVAAFVVSYLGEERKLYLTQICVDCL